VHLLEAAPGTEKECKGAMRSEREWRVVRRGAEWEQVVRWSVGWRRERVMMGQTLAPAALG
jgi:hypothetical protein